MLSFFSNEMVFISNFASLERAGYAPYETDDKAIIQRFYFIILILSIIIFMDILSEFFNSKMFID